MKKRFLLCNTFIPLFIGLLIYIMFRPDAYITQWLARFLHITSDCLRGFSVPRAAVDLILGHLGDMLWAYALTFMTAYVLQGTKSYLLAAVLIGTTLGGLLELGQALRIISGTPDIFDLVCEALSCILAVYLIKKHKGGTENESEN